MAANLPDLCRVDLRTPLTNYKAFLPGKSAKVTDDHSLLKSLNTKYPITDTYERRFAQIAQAANGRWEVWDASGSKLLGRTTADPVDVRLGQTTGTSIPWCVTPGINSRRSRTACVVHKGRA
jgi:hypothetical protein